MSALRWLLSATPRERRVALSTIRTVPLVRTKLRRLGYARTVDLLYKRPRRIALDYDQTAEDDRVARAVMRRLPLHMTCLERSLVVWWLVGGSDLAQIRFGVAPDGESATPDFHAWVEVDGIPLDDAIEVGVTYLPFEPSEPVRPDRFE